MLKIELLGKTYIKNSNSHSSFTQEELLDALWHDKAGITNPTSAVKTALHRFRNMFGPLGTDLVIYDIGKYRWNPDIRFSIDAEVFEKLAASEKPSDILKAAWMYEGDILESLSSPVIDSYRRKYHDIYLDTLDRALNLMESESLHDESLDLASSALGIDSSDERIYIHMMRALNGLGRYAETVNTFEKLHSISMENKAHISDEAYSLYHAAISESGNVAALDMIPSMLAEKEADDSCYVMLYDEFRTAVRFLRNNGIPLHLMLLEISEASPESHCTPASQDFMEIIRSATEAKDTAAQIDAVHFAVLMPYDSYETSGRKLSGIIHSASHRDNAAFHVTGRIMPLPSDD